LTSTLYRIFFNSSVLLPWLFAVTCASLINRDFMLALIYFIVLVVLILLQFCLQKWNHKNLLPKSIKVESVDGTQDDWLVIYLITYIAPFLDTLNFIPIQNLKYIAFLILLFVIMLRSNSNFNNPYLFILGYRSFVVITENGVTYQLLSKSRIRNKKNLRKVIRIFEYLLMEVQ